MSRSRSRSGRSRSRSRGRATKKSQVYIGGISRKTNTADLEKVFEKFGKIKEISVKDHFAFLVSPSLLRP